MLEGWGGSVSCVYVHRCLSRTVIQSTRLFYQMRASAAAGGGIRCFQAQQPDQPAHSSHEPSQPCTLFTSSVDVGRLRSILAARAASHAQSACGSRQARASTSGRSSRRRCSGAAQRPPHSSPPPPPPTLTSAAASAAHAPTSAAPAASPCASQLS